MEDVNRSNMHSRWVWCLLVLLSVAQTTLYAANQGKLSSSASRGTIGISLVIPEFTRLVARMDTESSKQDSKVCLHVVNRADLSRSNYYRVAALANSHSANLLKQIDDVDKMTHLVKLDNHVQTNDHVKRLCDYQNELVEEVEKTHNQTMLLMLITE